MLTQELYYPEQPSYSTVTESEGTKQQQEMMELQRSLIAELISASYTIPKEEEKVYVTTGMNCLKNSRKEKQKKGITVPKLP